MFTDMVGFTDLSERIGEEEVFELVRRIAGEQAASIRSHGGVLQDFAGDGIMAVFGAPVALEDACLRACRTAVDIQNRMLRLEPEFERTYGVQPKLRIGIHTGPAVVGQVGHDAALAYNALGDNVNVAARIQAAANPGTIFLSGASLDVVRGYVDAAAVGERKLKGKSEALALYRLDAIHAGVTRFGAKVRQGLGPLQERQNELSLLRSLWAEARQGKARAVDLVGDAGIGKSRLLFEFEDSLRNEDTIVLAAACRPEAAATPFLPLIELIRQWIGVTEDAPRTFVAEALSKALGELSLDSAKIKPFVLDLLSGGDSDASHTAVPASELVGVRTREALVDILLSWGRRQQPTVLVVEDLHWIDSGTEDVLTTAIGTLSNEGLLLLCSYRLGYQPRWNAGPRATQIALEPLSNESARLLLQDRLLGKSVADELISAAIARSEGNPLFTEEIATYLFEHAVRLPGASIGSDIPSSLENLIMDRVQRLDPSAAQLLQTASIIGRRFPIDLLTQISGMNGNVSSLLATLEQNGIVFRVDDDQPGSCSEYSFKHALTQDALYSSLLSGARSAGHEKVARELERLAGERTPEIAELLAHHFSRTKRTDRAVHYLALAADKSLRLFSLRETLLYLDQALELVRKDPNCADDRTVADILVNRLMVCCWEADFSSMVRFGQEYLPRVERLGPSRQLSRVLAWMGEGYLNSESFDEADEKLTRALSIGEEIGSEESIAYALWDIMWSHLLSPNGRSRDAYADMGRKILAAAKHLNDPYLETLTYYTLGADALQRGFLAEAQAWADRSIALGQNSHYPPALSIGWVCSSFIASVMGDGSNALEQAQKAYDASAGKTERICALCAKGLAELSAGRPAESLATFAEFHRQAEEAGFLALLVVSEVPQAAARAFSGDPVGAISDLERLIDRFARWGNARVVAWAHLVLGQINLGAGDLALPAAEQHLAEAAHIARDAGTKGFLLQALVAMASAGIGSFRDSTRKAAFAEAMALAEELGAVPVLAHLDSLALQ